MVGSCCDGKGKVKMNALSWAESNEVWGGSWVRPFLNLGLAFVAALPHVYVKLSQTSLPCLESTSVTIQPLGLWGEEGPDGSLEIRPESMVWFSAPWGSWGRGIVPHAGAQGVWETCYQIKFLVSQNLLLPGVTLLKSTPEWARPDFSPFMPTPISCSRSRLWHSTSWSNASADPSFGFQSLDKTPLLLNGGLRQWYVRLSP